MALEKHVAGCAQRWTKALAVCLWLLAFIAVIAYVGASRRDGSLAPFPTTALSGAGLMIAASAGTVLVWARPRNALGWLFSAVACLLAFAAGSSAYATYAIAVRGGGAPLGRLALWASVWAWVPALGLALMVVPLLLPDGRLPSAAWRPYLRFLLLCMGAYTVINMIAPISADDSGLPSVNNPYGIGAARALLNPLLSIGDFLALLFVLASLASLLLRYRHGDALLRARLAWTLLGGAPLAAYVLLMVAGAWLPRAAQAAGPTFALCAACVPLGATFGLLRPHAAKLGPVVEHRPPAGGQAVGPGRVSDLAEAREYASEQPSTGKGRAA